MSINNVSGVRSDITEMLSKIREVSNKSSIFTDGNKINAPQKFDDVMTVAKSAFSQVSQLQTQTEAVKNAYISGDSAVSMSQVVVASQKSKLAFEGLVTVRNKILEAYKEIMNMPV
jgi:flagellar hook-basal body complex protein FliE